MTLGAARCLGLQQKIGTLATGSEADFVVMDLKATALLERRAQAARSLTEVLSALLTLGDDRAVRATYSLGRLIASRTTLSLPERP